MICVTFRIHHCDLSAYQTNEYCIEYGRNNNTVDKYVKVKTHKTAVKHLEIRLVYQNVREIRDFRGNIIIALCLVGCLYINFRRQMYK